jgi:deazaflavin-dependent oxidoreductase (nitroreductase family)
MAPKAAERLARAANYQTLQLTHHGRKSKKPYEVTIWYMVDDGRLYLASANKARSWVRNVKVRPEVVIHVGGEVFKGKVRPIADPEEHERVMALVERKYWWAVPIIRLGRMLASMGLMADNSASFEVVLSDD